MDAGIRIRRHPCFGWGREGVAIDPSDIQKLKLKGMVRVSADIHSLAGDGLQQRKQA